MACFKLFTELFAILLISCTFIIAADVVKGKWFDRIVLIIFENTNASVAYADPYFKEITQRPNGVYLSQFYAVVHPSEPNYVAQIAGSTYGILDDETYDIDATTLVDLLEDKKVSWKGYFENYPGDCFLNATGGASRLYARKHNPFFSFTTVTKNSTRCAKVVNASQLDDDIKNNEVPQFVYFVPNLNDDAHDTNITYASSWFKSWFEPKLKEPSFTDNTLFFITFDESDNDNDTVNHIYSALYGCPVKEDNDHNDITHYNHYSYLRTVEDNWCLSSLNRNDSDATPFTKYLKEAN
ncbi:phosphoesterase family-domain-containing protein [Gigaspora rosea]|uniref:Phosphoesterase family-domain-containing protein n=1 Tax=Gigaspora rosea TaxID=44941 RepID=A0A397VAB5_9GLOM|nr:phosphoesterase family-domain-containing protein [Gigaspora rosea]CAG8442277.1 18409_t:CDS:2 [Gigaspora rosea]